MFACKDIFAKPSITQAHKVRKGRSPKLALARLTAFIIPQFSSFFTVLYERCDGFLRRLILQRLKI